MGMRCLGSGQFGKGRWCAHDGPGDVHFAVHLYDAQLSIILSSVVSPVSLPVYTLTFKSHFPAGILF